MRGDEGHVPLAPVVALLRGHAQRLVQRVRHVERVERVHLMGQRGEGCGRGFGVVCEEKLDGAVAHLQCLKEGAQMDERGQG